jgi:hypothetical protein
MVNIQKLKDLKKNPYMKIQVTYLKTLIIILSLKINLKLIIFLVKVQMDYLEKMMINFLKMNQIKLVYLEMIKIN